MIHVPSHFGLTKWATQDHPDIRRLYPIFLSLFPSALSDTNNQPSAPVSGTLSVATCSNTSTT